MFKDQRRSTNNGGSGSDSHAIHDDQSSEINALSAKASPTTSDVLLIEDAASSFSKKKVTIGSLPTGSDANAIHDDQSGEIAALTEKASPVAADVLVIEDSEATNVKKKIQIGNLPSGSDVSAIHDDQSGEIAALTEKASPVAADVLVIEDSEATNAKKKIQIGNLPSSGGYPDLYEDNESSATRAFRNRY